MHLLVSKVVIGLVTPGFRLDIVLTIDNLPQIPWTNTWGILTDRILQNTCVYRARLKPRSMSFSIPSVVDGFVR